MSFILWEFEDREFIFALVDMLLGTRMHNQFDSSIVYTCSLIRLLLSEAVFHFADCFVVTYF